MRPRRSFGSRFITLYAASALFALGVIGCGNGASAEADDTSPGGAGSGAAGGAGSSGSAGVGATASGGGTSGSGGDGSFDVDNFVQRLAKVRCDNLMRCYPTIGWMWEHECRAWMPSRLKARTYDAIPPLLEKATVVYHPEFVDDCLSDLGTSACADINALQPESCIAIFEGTSPSACTDDFECNGGYCCEEECVPRGDAGGECQLHSHCQNGLLCGADGCHKPNSVGASCSGYECEYGTVCGGPSDECEDETDVFSRPPAPEPAALGEVCVLAGFPDRCPDFDYCGNATSSIYLDNCAGASTCDSSAAVDERVCKELAVPGEDCRKHEDCTPLSACLSGSCALLKETGEECSRPRECLSAFCPAGECIPLTQWCSRGI